jgi:hypothetical protein
MLQREHFDVLVLGSGQGGWPESGQSDWDVQ